MSVVASQTSLTATRERATGLPEARFKFRLLLCSGAAAAVIAGSFVGDPAASLRADPDLGHLLRGMAVIKGALALGAIAALWWRFGRPIEDGTAKVYLCGAWFMAGAAMIVWQLAHVGVGAIAFHAGELTLLCVAWFQHRAEVRDRTREPAVSRAS
jgi:hypothetical protein